MSHDVFICKLSQAVTHIVVRTTSCSVQWCFFAGLGSSVTVKTSPDPNIGSQAPHFVFASASTIYRMKLLPNGNYEHPEQIYTVNGSALAIDFVGMNVFILDDSGGLHVLRNATLDGAVEADRLLLPLPDPDAVLLDLSVDWLDKKFVFVYEMRSQFGFLECELGRLLRVYAAKYSCPLSIGTVSDGSRCRPWSSVQSLGRPRHLTLDPYNGFAFWLESSNGDKLVRVDLKCTGNEAKILVEDGHFGGFVIYPEKMKLVLPERDSNRLLLVDMTGKEEVT